MQVSEFRAQPGTLYVVATPIGNLRDITLRALDILKSADLVAAEDTRVTSGLLDAYGLRAKLYAYHEHNEQAAASSLLARLRDGASVALVSDAGTPGISDPGAVVVRMAREAGMTVVPVPGPSAAVAALSVAGLAAGPWTFEGFLPSRAGARRKRLDELKELPSALVFYEAPHRILETVADLTAVLGPARGLCIGREITKRFESFHVCTLGEAEAWLRGDENRQRGEFVLLLEAPPAREDDMAAARQVLAVLLDELPSSQSVRLATRLTGLKKNALYDLALSLKPDSPT